MTISISPQRAKPAFTNREAIKGMLVHNHDLGMSWREIILDNFRGSPVIKSGTLSRIANSDYEPKKPNIRRALGLPEYINVSACPDCGGVHLSRRRCPDYPVHPLLAQIRDIAIPFLRKCEEANFGERK